MTNKSTTIILSDDRFSREHRVGINGRHFNIPVGEEVEVDEGILDVLRNSGAAFTVVGAKDGADNAVSVVRSDPPLSGGPKVVLGDDDTAETSSFAMNVSDNAELGKGEGSSSGASVASGDDPSQTDYSHDTGGASAPSPGSRDTIATSAQPAGAPAKKAAAKKAPAKK